MQLDSLGFIYLFLPVSMALFYLVPPQLKKPVLLLTTVAFYGLAQPFYLPVFLCGAVLDFTLINLMGSHCKNRLAQRICLGLSLGKSVAVLCYLGWNAQLVARGYPLGILVYSLNCAGYALDCYRGKAPCEESFMDFFLFTSFFGTLYVGPLARYEELMPQLKALRPSLTSISKGITLFVIGLAKKVILADNILYVFLELHRIEPLELGTLAIWVMVVSLALGVFFLLSAYSDMARGLGHIFSLEYPRNLYYPYQAKTIAEFFERLNLTTYDLITRHLQLPVKGEGKLPRTVANLLILGALMGLWFGLRLNFLVWGLLFGVLLVLEKHLYGRVLPVIPSLFKRIFTFGFTLISFAVFAGDRLGQSAQYLLGMFGRLEFMQINSQVLYLLSSNAFLILSGILLCSSVFDLIAVFVRKRAPLLADVVAALFNGVLLFVTTAFML